MASVSVVIADSMSSKLTDWIDNCAISEPNHAAANYRSSKVIFGFIIHFFCDSFGSTGKIICSNPTKNYANL